MRNVHISELSLTFTKTAFLLWETHGSSYDLANCLNKLYRLDLQRQDDLKMGEKSYPFFFHYDPPRGLLFVMIDVSGDKRLLQKYDKILIVNGRDAFDLQKQIYSEYAEHLFRPQENNLQEIRRYEMLQEAKEEVYTVQFVDYRDAEASNHPMELTIKTDPTALAPQKKKEPIPIPQTSLLSGISNKQSSKARKMLKELRERLEDLLYSIESKMYAYDDDDVDETLPTAPEAIPFYSPTN